MLRAVALALVLAGAVSAGDLAAQTLRGSRVAMKRQNQVARQQDYTFLQTSAQVRRFVQNGWLVRVPGNGDYALAGVSHPYARPAVRTFLERLGAQHHAACGERLVVTSLTRPVRNQPRNASDLSVHPAGMAVDLRISRKASCRRWLEKTLLSLESRRVIDATRERRPAHYHVAVFPDAYESYVRRLSPERPPVKLASSTTRKPATRAAALPPEPDPVEIADPVTLADAGPAADPGAAQEDVGGYDEAGDAGVPEGAADAAESPETGDAPDSPQAADADRREVVGAYRVNRGDTLWTIARRHGTTVDQLQALNQLRSTRIAAGQVISVPIEITAR